MFKKTEGNFLGAGLAFPVNVNDAGNFRISQYEKSIAESINIILGTSKGERVMRPDFGCGIHAFVFSVINTATLTLIENSVKEALTLWEPRINLRKVEISTEEAAEGKLMISVDYEVRTTNNRFNLVYPFYLQEGK